MWLGVTVAIPDPYRSVLTAARAGAGDPLAHTIPPHVTLVPPTRIDASRFNEVQERLAQSVGNRAPFTISLRGTGTFRPVSPVVYVGLQEGWDECVALREQLAEGALAQELPYSYHPHVTIAHNLPAGQLDEAQVAMRDFSAQFTVSTIELYEYHVDEWYVIDSFALAG